VRGTHDILPEEATKRKHLLERLSHAASLYGFGQIETPMFEFSDVFHRTLGDTSDVVTKETYTFTDRGGETLTLRPEFTAGVARSFISNSLQDQLPFKVYYHGPAFRYERPQKGRLRQFHQFGVELLGIAEPVADVETIALATQGLEFLGLREHVTLEINSLGDAESRNAYRTALVEYFSRHASALSEDSKNRLQKNPLRILDSKDESDKKLIANVPSAQDYFTPEAKAFFAEVQASLSALKIAYTINPRLVRGLDYYSHTVFECTTDKLGAQGTVLAGGRYDGLVKLMGGPDTPGIGWAAGIERLLALMEATGASFGAESAKPIAVIPIDEAQEKDALILAQSLRNQGFVVELLTRGNMGKKMKRADKIGARFALMLGDSEIKSNQVTVKKPADGSQQTLPAHELKKLLA
jgi:histidyl-tRNA synthetase